MAVQMLVQILGALDQLRYEPTGKRIRATVGTSAVVDSTGALLVWEPRRVVPSYAVPVADVLADLVPAAPASGTASPVQLSSGGPSVLDPSTGFAAHTADGRSFTVRTAGGERDGAAFRPADPDLADYVVLDFAAFDRWLEEDDEVVSHPRDPFHRVDVRRSSRHVRIERGGQVLADSARPLLVFETALITRCYLPPADVRMDLLGASPTRSACAYKGVASYLSYAAGDVADVAWTYERPLPDAAELTGLVCFFDERVDVTVDGTPQPRPVTPWS